MTEVTSEVWRRDERVHDLRVEFSLQALHSEDATPTTKSRMRWTKSALDTIGSGKHSNEESRAAQSSAGPENWSFRQREGEFLREVRRHNNDRAKCGAQLFRNRTNLESHESRTSEDQQVIRDLRSEGVHVRAPAVPPNLTRNLEAKMESQKCEIQSVRGDQPQFDSMCLCWWECCYIDIICQQNHGTSNQSSTTSWGWPPAILTKRACNDESSFKIGCSSELATSKQL